MGQAGGQSRTGLIAGALGLGQGVEVAAQRRPVAAAGRSGERRAGAQGGHVVDGGPGQGEERLEVQADRGGHPLHLAQQRHHVVGRDAGGGVIRRPVAVGDLDHAAPQARHHVAGQWRPGDGEGDSRAEAGGTDLAVGQGHQRVHGRSQRMWRQGVEPERTGEVGHRGARGRHDRGGDLGDGVVGGGDDEQVDIGGRARQHVMTPEETGELPAAGNNAAAKDVPARPGPMIRMECI